MMLEKSNGKCKPVTLSLPNNVRKQSDVMMPHPVDPLTVAAICKKVVNDSPTRPTPGSNQRSASLPSRGRARHASAPSNPNRSRELLSNVSLPSTSKDTSVSATNPRLNQTIADTNPKEIQKKLQDKKKTIEVIDLDTPESSKTLTAQPTPDETANNSIIDISDGNSTPASLFPRVPVKFTLSRGDRDVFLKACQFMVNHPNYLVVLEPQEDTPSIGPALVRHFAFPQKSGTIPSLNRFLSFIAAGLFDSGVLNTKVLPTLLRFNMNTGPYCPLTPQIPMGSLHYPTGEFESCCVTNMSQSTVCTMNHQELADIEQMMIFATYATHAAKTMMQARIGHLRDLETKMNIALLTNLTDKGFTSILNANRAAMTIAAQIIALRRRDVIDNALPINDQIALIGSNVTHSTHLIEDYTED